MSLESLQTRNKEIVDALNQNITHGIELKGHLQENNHQIQEELKRLEEIKKQEELEKQKSEETTNDETNNEGAEQTA